MARVLKFGGSSLATGPRLRAAAVIAAAAAARDGVVLVVSAVQGATDTLLALADDAAGRPAATAAGLAALSDRHRAVLALLAEGDGMADLRAALERRLALLSHLLAGVAVRGRCGAGRRDAVAACGERLAVVLALAALRRQGLDAEGVDAVELIATDSSFGAARVDAARTAVLTGARLGGLDRGRVVVVPGFLGGDPQGRTTTLGRGGSDYSAALLGAALGVSVVEIWTDVPGVLSAPPRWVPMAGTVRRLSYAQARALARWGGKVLHERTVEPVEPLGIPLRVGSTMDPEGPSTLVQGAGGTGKRVVVTARGGLTVLATAPPGATATEDPVEALGRSGLRGWRAGRRLGLGQVVVAAGDADGATAALTAAGWSVPWRREGSGAVVVVADGAAGAGVLLERPAFRRRVPVLAELPRLEDTAAGVIVREHVLRRAVLALHGELWAGASPGEGRWAGEVLAAGAAGAEARP